MHFSWNEFFVWFLLICPNFETPKIVNQKILKKKERGENTCKYRICKVLFQQKQIGEENS